jgi:hypothetical protein
LTDAKRSERGPDSRETGPLDAGLLGAVDAAPSVINSYLRRAVPSLTAERQSSALDTPPHPDGLSRNNAHLPAFEEHLARASHD